MGGAIARGIDGAPAFIMKVSIIIPAAGSGQRFGGDKLSRDLHGRPVLVRTIEAFTRRDEVAQIIVAGPPEGFELFADRFGPVLGFHGVDLVQGGRADRWETVSLALQAVSEDATHVGVHDAARPCLSEAMLDRVFEAADRLDAVIPGVDISSTVKEVDRKRSQDVAVTDALADAILGAETADRLEAMPVTRTVPRDGLILAQTPQIFRGDLLARVAAKGMMDGVSDDASAVEQLGVDVHVVPGDPCNIKITQPEDLALAAAILSGLRSGGL